jgi:PAT family beta-lactamase induction signal transducer AmpG
MGVSFIFGFTAGIPLALTAATLQAWMVDEKISLTTIGLYSMVGLPYTIKFLWAPFVDRWAPPLLHRRFGFGRRRGWLIITQLAVIGSICAMAFSNPGEHPLVIAALATLLAFCSASYDIVNDAYRIEILSQEEYGLGSSVYVMAYRLAMFISGGGALILADAFQKSMSISIAWRYTYLIMGGLMLTGLITVLLCPDPQTKAKPPQTLRQAVVEPLMEYFKRAGAISILLFLVIYKLDTNLTVAMTTPFMMSLGFTKTDIGAVVKGFGTFALMGGTLVAGLAMVRLGLKRSLWIFGILQSICGLIFFALSKAGHHYPLMVASITAENFLSGMGLAAQSAFMMALVDKRFTATQYSLITSFMALSRYVASAPSGWLADHVGWGTYFIICTLIGIPGLLMLTRYNRWTLPQQ